MPNLFAEIALFIWVPAALVFYRLFRPVTAATVTIIGAMVLLPANFSVDPPGLPPIDRHVVGGMGAIIGYLLVVPRRARHKMTARWPIVLVGALVLCAFVTVSTNTDALRYGDRSLPALSDYDAVGLVFNRLLTIGIPFLLGAKLVRTFDDVLSVLRVIVTFGLIYVPLVLWEARMSPQLHTTLYGYFPHDFYQHLRGGGYRPVVFTASGLECALFLATATIAAIGLYQAKVRVLNMHPIVPAVALVVALAVSMSLAPLLYGLLVPALMLWTRPTTQARLAWFIAFVILSYPLLRSQDLFPTKLFVDAAESISHDRAYSLEFRFRNEDALLQKARERFIFGWGSWGRNQIYDPTTGTDASVADGYWIIEMGRFGLTGFLSFFGLLLLPLILAARTLRSVPAGRARQVVVALLLLVLVRAIDLIPNGFLAPTTMFLAGALLQVTTRARATPRARAEPRAVPARGPISAVR
jgi:hypothetical protein